MVFFFLSGSALAEEKMMLTPEEIEGWHKFTVFKGGGLSLWQVLENGSQERRIIGSLDGVVINTDLEKEIKFALVYYTAQMVVIDGLFKGYEEMKLKEFMFMAGGEIYRYALSKDEKFIRGAVTDEQRELCLYSYEVLSRAYGQGDGKKQTPKIPAELVPFTG